jgi:4a-hydroxytetrahydrobiopterin dehydratase
MIPIRDEQDVRAWLETELPSWRLVDGHLTRRFETGGWPRTLLLAGGIAYLAEAVWHHPELRLEYPRLTVRLRTHEPDGITDRDLELARRIEELATRVAPDGSCFERPPGPWIR